MGLYQKINAVVVQAAMDVNNLIIESISVLN